MINKRALLLLFNTLLSIAFICNKYFTAFKWRVGRGSEIFINYQARELREREREGGGGGGDGV